MGLINRMVANAVSKVLGLPSVEDYAQRNIGEFFGLHGIKHPQLRKYRLDKSVSDPRFDSLTFIGTAQRDGRDIGLLIVCSEATGATQGAIIDVTAADNHAAWVRKYNNEEVFSSFYSFLSYELKGRFEELTPSWEYKSRNK